MRRRLAPASLTLRLFLLLLLGVAAAAALSLWLAQRDRREVIAHFHGREAAQRIADTLRVLAPLPAVQRARAFDGFTRNEWRFAPAAECRGRPAPHLAEAIGERIGDAATLDRVFRQLPPDGESGDASGPPAPPPIAVLGRFADGEPFCLLHRGQRRVPPPIEQWRFPVSLALFLALIALVAWFAVRYALRPLERMAAAAEAFGHDIRHPPLADGGPSEVRKAAAAFNRMQERVRAMMTERTQILAAVTHDLKTPLTRMRLRLEACADAALREKLGNDLAAMQRLVDEGLELARSLEASEAVETVDVDALLSSIADDAADAGQPVRYTGSAPLPLRCRPNALRRALENLVDNAIKYGDTAEISLTCAAGHAVIAIRDRGPGIPEAQLAAVLRPFVRLEASRSRESGGTGLGLAIASNLLASMGARLILENLPAGGLEARVELPLTAASR